ncbi:UNVERIFIED_CONTAM: hypothetical protein GTU68_011614 [Idotea baltica]|nr:hypothetical protein [Idotea baltica]
MFASCSGEKAATDDSAKKAAPATAKTEKKAAPAKPTKPVVNPNQAADDDKKIQDYLSAKGLKAQKTAEGVYYIITKEGDGANPKLEDKVQCHYKGYLLDGSEFDSSYSRNQPATFPLRGVVKGWQVGIPLIKKGGKATLFIPSTLGYGARAIGAKIPANSVLAFDVELLDIVK